MEEHPTAHQPIERRPIHPAELRLGKPLPLNAYDDSGTLMLREGYLLESGTLMDNLLRHAHFVERRGERLSTDTGHATALTSLRLAREELQVLLNDRSPKRFSTRTRAVATRIRRACRLAPDLALATIMLRRDGDYVSRHSVNVAIACEIVGTALRLPLAELSSIVAAALTMNLGMLALQQQLQSQEQPLSDSQHRWVRLHCEHSVALLQQHGVSDPLWLQSVLDHHEQLDGSGYPAGKRDEAIALPARLLALADTYCARISRRDYRPSLQPDTALRWLFQGEGTRVDEALSEAMIRTLGIYPPGTGVRLRDGRVAIVTHRGPEGGLPRLHVLGPDSLISGLWSSGRGAPSDRHDDAISEVIDLETLHPLLDLPLLWGPQASP